MDQSSGRLERRQVSPFVAMVRLAHGLPRQTLLPLLLLVALLAATPARAITYGTADGNKHPNVGALVVNYPPFGGDIVWCSGTLIAPTVFLTAAHCVVGNPSGLTVLGVSFDPDPIAHLGSLIPVASADIHSHPGYSQRASDPHDLAVITIAAQHGLTPAALPSLNQFEQMAKKNGLRGQQFTAVGYGALERRHEPGSGQPQFGDGGTRMNAVSSFNALTKAWLRLSQNPATGDAGTCYGDSGGPNFLGAGKDETGVIAAVTVTGDTPCRATNVVYRLDTPGARSFLAEYVTLPAAKAATAGKNAKGTVSRNHQRNRGHRH